MSFSERDFIRRLIEDFGRLVAAIIALRRGGKLDEAEQQIAEVAGPLLGPLARDAELLDSETLGRMLSEERLDRYATLIAERANVRLAKANTAGADSDRLRALELFLEADAKRAARGSEPSPELCALLEVVGLAALSPRYRELAKRSARTPKET